MGYIQPVNVLQQIFAQSGDLNQFKSGYLRELHGLLRMLDDTDLVPFARSILDCHRRGGKILAMGNGGSAANAAHFATGVGYVTRRWEDPVRAIALGMDPVLGSSLANDHGYENVFLRQLQVLLEPRDLVVAFSVSGNSANLVRAMEYADSKGATTFALLGHDGGTLRGMCREHLLIAHPDRLFGLTEDVHMVVGHILGYHLEFLKTTPS